MFYKYESTLDNDLIFWSNATADLRHNGEIGEDDLPDELLHPLNELWTDGHLVSCYLVELKGRYGIALESIYDRDFAESLGITYGELAKRVEKKANYISRESGWVPIYFGQFAIYDLGTTVLRYTVGTLSEREKGTRNDRSRTPRYD